MNDDSDLACVGGMEGGYFFRCFLEGPNSFMIQVMRQDGEWYPVRIATPKERKSMMIGYLCTELFPIRWPVGSL